MRKVRVPVELGGVARDERLWKRVGVALGAGRVALGSVFWLAPVTAVRSAGLDRLTAPRTAWLARMTAGRDVALGAGTLAATLRGADPRERAAWLVAGAVADLGDAVAIRRGAREGHLGRIPAFVSAAAAGGATVVGLVAAGRELAVGQPKSS